MEGGSVDELLDVTVECPGLEQLQVEVAQGPLGDGTPFPSTPTTTNPPVGIDCIAAGSFTSSTLSFCPVLDRSRYSL